MTFVLAAVLGVLLWFITTLALAALISGAIAPLGSVELAVLGVIVAVAEIALIRSAMTRRRRDVTQ